MKKKKKPNKDTPSPSLTAQLFEDLLACDELHVPSSRTRKYRNKITYGIPLTYPLSDLAQDDVNHVCEIVAAYSTQDATISVREVMVKVSRSKSLTVRVTVHTPEPSDTWKEPFVQYMVAQCSSSALLTSSHSLDCLCYNEAFSRVRPTKDDPVHLLYGQPYIFERTPPPASLEYQVSPDTFGEINHEVERLQYHQAKEWLLEHRYSNSKWRDSSCTLLVSGRDVSSFGLGFGSLTAADADGADETTNQSPTLLFDEVLAVQHCPWVHADAVANFERNAASVKATAYLKTKQEMATAIQTHMVAKCGEDPNNKSEELPLVFGVMTGGRKGLDPHYLNYLVQAQHIQLIIYNSCSTKSLIRDMEGLLAAFSVQDFRSCNFFPGTHYTASLTLLIRRPTTTLVLPVGPAGVGKTRLAEGLVAEGRRIDQDGICKRWNRDELFVRLKDQGVGWNKTKSLVHQDLLTFLSSQQGILYVDSTNGSEEARSLYIRKANAGRVVYAIFKPRGTHEEVLPYLMNCTRHRLGENAENHPSFPTTVEGQREKHTNILKGISYPGEAERCEVEEGAGEYSVACCTFDCHASEDRSRRSFRLWDTIMCSGSLRAFIN